MWRSGLRSSLIISNRRLILSRFGRPQSISAEYLQDVLPRKYFGKSLAQRAQFRLLLFRVVRGRDIAAEDDFETSLVSLPRGGAAAEVGECAADGME